MFARSATSFSIIARFLIFYDIHLEKTYYKLRFQCSTDNIYIMSAEITLIIKPAME